jgi:hypothetical protein
MSKPQALLETLLGVANLNGNRVVASNIRNDLRRMSRSHESDGYQRLARAAGLFEQRRSPRYAHCKAA